MVLGLFGTKIVKIGEKTNITPHIFSKSCIFATQIRFIAASARRGRKVRATQSTVQVNGLMFERV